MKTGTTTLKGDTITGEALKYLEASGGRCLAVVDEDGAVIGLFSLKGFPGRSLNGDRPGETAITADDLAALACRPVREFMSKSFHVVGPLEPVESVAGRFFITAAPAPEAVLVVDDHGLFLGLIEREGITRKDA